jgi:PST family polysaccharide transporter
MQFGSLVAIDLAALASSIVAGIAAALAGWGYWALVIMAISQPGIALILVWIVTRWIPGAPRRVAGIRAMVRYGGLLTANGLVVYVAYNLDKVLLGRFWGAEALGIYGRAYQLVSIPTENLHNTVGWVMFPALSRLQSDPERTRSYFLRGYRLFLSIVTPITAACALFADDIVRVVLGGQWSESVPVFRLLAPTILTLALINPFGHLMQAGGHVARSLMIAFLILPTVLLGYLLGLPYGAKGVALGYSTAMVALIVPVAFFARRGTTITGRDLLGAIVPPFVAAAIGSVAAFWCGLELTGLGPLARLIVTCSVLFGVHGACLLLLPRTRRDLRDLRGALGS